MPMKISVLPHHVFLFALLAVLAGRCALVPLAFAQAAVQPGAHAAAGKAAAEQREGDWVDGRWNQTDVGPFLASNLQTPVGSVAKGLSIRVGERGEAAVCYDTGEPAFRGAWTGGFLKFDQSRFGLARPPMVAGEWAFAAAGGLGWPGGRARHEALHVNGARVVLDTRVGETLVRESPWFEATNGTRTFTRTLEIAPGQTALTLQLADDKHSPGSLALRLGFELATLQQKETRTGIALRAGTAAKLSVTDSRVEITFPPRTETQRIKLFLWSGPAADLPAFEKLLPTSPAPENLAELSRPGPARWLPALTTKAQAGFAKDGFAVDTLTAPYANPWQALLFFSGVDFFRDGSAAVCTIHGDVWRVRGLDDSAGQLTWKRFATGLFQPLGLRVVDDQVYVLGRDQITRLHDDNGDGEADRYENFHNGIITTPGHDYVACLERDAAGNFYYVDPRGVHRVSADGRSSETIATGFRNPNGLGVSPGGLVTVTPQQGTWTPSSAIIEAKRGGFYGFNGPQITAERPLGYDPMLCWLPHAFDNSSSSQVWVPAGKWGALGGQLLHFAWGRCALMLVLRDAASSPVQGAAVALPGRFISGPMRGTFRPQDGQLYVACSTGWQTSATRDGALQRVRYASATPLRVPLAWRAHRNGLALTFAEPLEHEPAEDAGSYSVHQWNYRYAKAYGSKDYSVANPTQEGRDEVAVRSARVLADGRTVFLETTDLQPVMQMEVKYNLRFTSGAAASGPLYLTLNRLDNPLAPPQKTVK